jgi:hypothetical protein
VCVFCPGIWGWIEEELRNWRSFGDQNCVGRNECSYAKTWSCSVGMWTIEEEWPPFNKYAKWVWRSDLLVLLLWPAITSSLSYIYLCQPYDELTGELKWRGMMMKGERTNVRICNCIVEKWDSLSLSLSQEINCQLVHALHPLFPLVLQGQWDKPTKLFTRPSGSGYSKEIL